MKRLASLLLLFAYLSLPAFAQIPVKEDTAIEVDFWFFDAALGTNETGLTVTGIACRTVKNGVTTASFSPTASGGSNDMVELGHGGYRLELTAAQLDTAGMFTCACSISGSVSNPVRLQVVPAASYALNYEGSVGSMQGVWDIAKTTADDTAGGIGAHLAGIIQNHWAELIASHAVADSFGARTARTGVDSRPIDVSSGGAVSPDWANVEAPTTTVGLSGTTISTGQVVASVAGAVGSVTGLTASNLDTTVSSRMATYTQPTGFLAATFPTTVASTTNITGGTITTVTNLTNLPTIPTNWITAGGINADAFTAAKFASDASTEFATTFLGSFIEGTTTLKQSAQYWNGALVGKYNSSAGTFNFRDLADTKNRIIYTTTATSRATVTLSPD